MFGRPSDAKIGSYMVRAIDPMAKRLGLDTTYTWVNPPDTPDARLLDAFRCGQSLLMKFAYPTGWPTDDRDEKRSPKLAKRAAKIVFNNLLSDAGANAVAYMTQGFGHEMARFWRHAADSGAPEIDSDQLRLSAVASMAMAELAEDRWPISDPHGALDVIAEAECTRVMDPDNPNAMIDLRSYFGQARVVCGAAGIALGRRVEEFQSFIFSPLWLLDLEFGLALQHEWVYHLDIWRNLLSHEPLSYLDFMRLNQGT